MKKQKTTKKSFYQRLNKKLLIIFSAVLILITGAVYFVTPYISRYKSALDKVESITISDMILNAVDGINRPAPIDPKTGDLYFPEQRLFMPPSLGSTEVEYFSSVPGDEVQELLITDEIVYRHASNRMIGAQNVDQLFKEVPGVQACSRAIKILYTQQADSSTLELIATKVLKNGKTLYIFGDKECSALKEGYAEGLLNSVKAIDSY